VHLMFPMNYVFIVLYFTYLIMHESFLWCNLESSLNSHIIWLERCLFKDDGFSVCESCSNNDTVKDCLGAE